MPVVPIIGVVASLWLVTFLQWETWVRFAIWFAIGLGVYFGYSRKHSKLAQQSSAEAPRPEGDGARPPVRRARAPPS